MNSKEIAEVIERLVDRTLFDLKDVPSSMLDRLKSAVDREVEERKDEPKVRLVVVCFNGFIDKYFKESDIDLAFDYARKSLDEQSKKGCASIEVGNEVVKLSDVEQNIKEKGRYERS